MGRPHLSSLPVETLHPLEEEADVPAPPPAPPDLAERYVDHLERTVEDLRSQVRRLEEEVREQREDAWRRGIQCAQLRAEADAQRRQCDLLFELLVELEGRPR